jgi:hypothetical protein
MENLDEEGEIDLNNLMDNEEENVPKIKRRRIMKKNEVIIDDLDDGVDLDSKPIEEELDGDDMDSAEDENSESFVPRPFLSMSQSYMISPDQLREAQEIFGETFEDFDEEGEQDNAENQDVSGNKASIEYTQLLYNFNLDEDEEFRSADYPERYLAIEKDLHDNLTKQEEAAESDWIVSKLCNYGSPRYLADAVPIVLLLIHVSLSVSYLSCTR